MNRKERRALAKQAPVFSGGVAGHGQTDALRSIADLMEEARRQYRQGDGAKAEGLCRQIRARADARS